LAKEKIKMKLNKYCLHKTHKTNICLAIHLRHFSKLQCVPNLLKQKKTFVFFVRIVNIERKIVENLKKILKSVGGTGQKFPNCYCANSKNDLSSVAST
jgi:hypothetical protein